MVADAFLLLLWADGRMPMDGKLRKGWFAVMMGFPGGLLVLWGLGFVVLITVMRFR